MQYAIKNLDTESLEMMQKKLHTANQRPRTQGSSYRCIAPLNPEYLYDIALYIDHPTIQCCGNAAQWYAYMLRDVMADLSFVWACAPSGTSIDDIVSTYFAYQDNRFMAVTSLYTANNKEKKMSAQ
jgi:hypothetical protein